MAAIALCCLMVAVACTAVSQTGFKFEPETRARLVRMIQKHPEECVTLIEEANSIDALRQTLIEQITSAYRAEKIAEAAQALRETGLPPETTVREIQETAETLLRERTN